MMALGVGLPDERLGLVVMGFDEAVDGRLQGDERVANATLEPPFGELGEEGLDRVQPGARGRREVEHPARMANEPLAHLGLWAP